jgi:hypothetical protein
MEEQKRHSGFEAMRILSMVMIVLMHGIGHGGLGSAAPQGSAAFWIYWLLFILARVSTNCYYYRTQHTCCKVDLPARRTAQPYLVYFIAF